MDTNSSGKLTTAYVESPVSGGSDAAYRAGQLLGGALNEPIKFIKQYSMPFFKVLIAITVVILLGLLVYNVSRVADDVSFSDALIHRKCKERGGCGRKCPYIAPDDPRLIIYMQARDVSAISDVIKDDVKEVVATAPSLVAMFTDDAVVKSVQNKCEVMVAAMTNAADTITTLNATAKSINNKYGDETALTSTLISAKNRMDALHAAATIMSHYYVASFFALTSFVWDQFIMQRSVEDPGIVSVRLVHESNAKHAYIINAYGSAFAGKFSDNSDFTAWVKALYDDNTAVGTVIDNMVKLMSMSSETLATIKLMLTKHADIERIFNTATKSGFTNKLPGEINSEAMSTLIASNDYDTAVKLSALEPEVTTNHAKFAKERASFDSGGGVPSVRDDDNDVNPWVGLFGRPTYRRSDGKSAETSSEPLRSIPSDKPEDLMREKSFRISFA